VLTIMYVTPARHENPEARTAFGEAYANYAAEVPGFTPRLSRFFGQSSAGSYRHR
jgi:protein-S-isoprenylcysteine O-methyltransferase Ste14